MKRIAALAALVAAGLVIQGRAATVDRSALAKKQERMTAEYGLAKDAKFYFVFDVRGRKIELRVRGMVLKTWPIESMRFWGRPDFSGTADLVKKTALKAPERKVIKPGESEVITTPAPAAKPGQPGAAVAGSGADYDLEALELRDMPTRFSLELSNGLHISIKSRTGGAPSLGVRLKDAWRWYVGMPLQNLFGTRRGKSLSELELTFADGKDPQSIYWHLFDGIKGIII